MITLSWLLIITVLAAALALVDGISRLRSRRSNSVLAVAELVFAALMLLAIFLPQWFPAPLGLLLFAILLEVALILVLVVRGRGGTRGGSAIAIIALVLNTIVILIALGWLAIPGLA